jgi:hypothetical protein
MRRLGKTKTVLLAATMLLVLSIVLSTVSLFPIYTGERQTRVLTNSTFTLSPNEVYREGLGSFRGIDENITIQVQSPTAFDRNVSIITPDPIISHFNVSSNSDITYTFPTGADYYEAVFLSNASTAGIIHFTATVSQPQTLFPYSNFTQPAKILFIVSLAVVMLAILKIVSNNFSMLKLGKSALPLVSKKNQRYILMLIVVSFVIWLIFLSVNSNPLGTFDSWYTDNARHSYTSSLFLKDGFSVFNTPLGALANTDASLYKFVTWPEMPHLYPLGSIFLFAPFGVLLQNGITADLVYTLQIGFFLVVAHVCLYFFLTRFLKKDLLSLFKAGGFYIIYVSLIIYAADGMFDSVAFLFSIFAIFMFMTERYDNFFLLVAVSIFFKYQAGIFLLPLILVGVFKLLQENRLAVLARNKAVVIGTVLAVVSICTAVLSAPYLLAAAPQLIMNGVNAFSPNTQIPWLLQSFYVLLTLGVTLAYAFYMLNRNSLLSLSSLFLLFPSFILPYFQNWYLPFIFIYILIPQQKKDLDITMVWLIFMIVVLSFGAAAFNPLQLFGALKHLLRF